MRRPARRAYASAVQTFAKGHGTGNDFVLLPDDAGRLELAAAAVRALCDRRRGLGADGVLRVVPTRLAAEPAVAALADSAEWFMDYRNADGSLAEMCGNGARVFAHYLFETGRAAGAEVVIATRGGRRRVSRRAAGLYAVEMGRAEPLAGEIQVAVADRSWPAVGVLLPNPHAVAFVEDLAEAGELLLTPTAQPGSAFPDGANFEFVVERGPRQIALRVHERGVGETLSCGTGACAAAWAARRRAGAAGDTAWQVEVPGGRLEVEEDAAGEITLVGPAVLVAAGELNGDWWNGA